MQKPSRTYWPRQRRSGVTLVEALAGTALLGTLLAAILLANAGVRRQAMTADRRQEACRVADRLLDKWDATWPNLPCDTSGPVENEPLWNWRTTSIDNPQADSIGGQVLKVEVYKTDQPDVAVQVHLLLPKPKASP